jgi:lactate racemase
MNGRYDIDNDFRTDLADVARLIGLRWMVMVHVNGRRQIVRLVSGDPEHAYPAAAAFSRERFAAPLPKDADVVVANAYPMDVSATFMRSKGVIPLLRAPSGASRLLLAACPEGVGHHAFSPSSR